MKRRTKIIWAIAITGHFLLWDAISRAETVDQRPRKPSMSEQARQFKRELDPHLARAAAERIRPGYFSGREVERQTALAYCKAMSGNWSAWKAQYCANASAGR